MSFINDRGGRFLEDFLQGEHIAHWPGRTITEADNIWFTLLTMNTNPIHFDTHFAATTEFKKPLVNSCLTLSMVSGMSVRDVSLNAIANLGWDEVRLTAPVFCGDTIYAASDVLTVRASKSRPGQGIVIVKTVGTKANGDEFLTFKRTILIPSRSSSAPSMPP